MKILHIMFLLFCSGVVFSNTDSWAGLPENRKKMLVRIQNNLSNIEQQFSGGLKLVKQHSSLLFSQKIIASEKERLMFEVFEVLPVEDRRVREWKQQLARIRKNISYIEKIVTYKKFQKYGTTLQAMKKELLSHGQFFEDIILLFRKNKSYYKHLKQYFFLHELYKKELLVMEQEGLVVRELKNFARRHVGVKYHRYPLVNFIEKLEKKLVDAYDLLRSVQSNRGWFFDKVEKFVLDIEELRTVIMSDKAYVVERRLYLYEMKPGFAKTSVKYIVSHMLILVGAVGATIGTIFLLGL